MGEFFFIYGLVGETFADHSGFIFVTKDYLENN